MSPKLCYQLGEFVGQAHALNKIEKDFDMDRYALKKFQILKNQRFLQILK